MRIPLCWKQRKGKPSTIRGEAHLAPDADPRRLAMAVFASLEGGLLLTKTHKDAEPLRIALDAAYTHLRSFRTRQVHGTRNPSH